MRKPRKPLSELQKANLLTGQLLRKCSCTSELILLLQEHSYYGHARLVEDAYNLGRKLAQETGKKAVAKAREKQDV